MSKIIEISKPGEFENAEKPEFGFCPLMSRSELVPEAVPGAISAGLDGQQQMRLKQINMMAPCLGADCGFWSVAESHCAVVSLPAIAENSKRPNAGFQARALELLETVVTLVEPAKEHFNDLSDDPGKPITL